MEFVSLKGLVKEDWAPLGKQFPFEDSAAQGPEVRRSFHSGWWKYKPPAAVCALWEFPPALLQWSLPRLRLGDTAELRFLSVRLPAWLVFWPRDCSHLHSLRLCLFQLSKVAGLGLGSPFVCCGLETSSTQYAGITAGLTLCFLFLGGHSPVLLVVHCVKGKGQSSFS